MTYEAVKRAVDVAVSLAGLTLLAPLLLLAAAAVKLDSSGPVFFRQKRVGKDGKAFCIFKLRTMVRDADQQKIPVTKVRSWEAEGRDPRITRVGRSLRKFGVDEFPQLINVIKGDMSLVGPRPYYLPRMESDPELGGRLSVKPGFLSLALVNGGVRLSEEEIKAYDAEYMRNRSLWLDVKILARAAAFVLSGRGFS